jgi:uncharacterized coiled-coil DUF342 family protein
MGEIENINGKIDKMIEDISCLKQNDAQYKIFIEQLNKQQESFTKQQEANIQAMQEVTNKIMEIKFNFENLNEKHSETQEHIRNINTAIRENEDRHMIDTRVLETDGLKQKLIQGGIIGAFITLGISIIEIVKIFTQ